MHVYYGPMWTFNFAAGGGRRQRHLWWSSAKRWWRQIIGGEELSNTPEGYNGHAPRVSLVKLQTGNSRLESVWLQASRRPLRRRQPERVLSTSCEYEKDDKRRCTSSTHFNICCLNRAFRLVKKRTLTALVSFDLVILYVTIYF